MIGPIEEAAAAYVTARLNVLALKKQRAACVCEDYEAPETDARGMYYYDGHPECRFRPDDKPCAPCAERAKINARISKATAAARRRFIDLAGLVKAAEFFAGLESKP